MALDFGNAEPQQDYGDLIPGGTLARVKMEIRYPSGNDAGEFPELTKSTTSPAQFLDCEFTILSEPMATRKFWMNIMFSNVSDKAMNISQSLFRGILESARGIMPTDMSEMGHKARRCQSLADFNGLEFAAKVGIERGKGEFDDKNKLQVAITPDKPEYQRVMQGETIVGETKVKSTKTQTTPPSTPAWGTNQKQEQPAAPAQAAAPGQSTVPDWAK